MFYYQLDFSVEGELYQNIGSIVCCCVDSMYISYWCFMQQQICNYKYQVDGIDGDVEVMFVEVYCKVSDIECVDD